jgi:hypothetical protein
LRGRTTGNGGSGRTARARAFAPAWASSNLGLK